MQLQGSLVHSGRQGLHAPHVAPLHAPSRRAVLRRQRFEAWHETRRVAVCVAEQTREEALAPTAPPAAALQGSLSSVDWEALYSKSVDCPHGGVLDVMRSNARGVFTCTPNQTLEEVVPLLSKVTGLPVIGPDNRVCGVISRKDIIRVRKAEGNMLDKVEQHMTRPAITINVSAPVEEAADLMLSKKIRRLPVVDEQGYPLGIVSRSDIFKPLFMDAYTQYMDAEAAAVQGLSTTAPSQKKKKKITWSLKYLYDGDCSMCQSLKTVLERQDKGKGRIKFVNIASDSYNPAKHMGIEYEDAMTTIHVLKPTGEVLYGTEALRAMFNEVGLGWAANLSELPLLNKIVDLIYDFLSKNRIVLSGALGGALDAIIAAKRIEMSKGGVEACGDLDEECQVEW